ncbi:MAG: RtcB family protein [Acidobacteria bacterium]|nr:RtcB family protein [Acidobacteriota bacterium]
MPEPVRLEIEKIDDCRYRIPKQGRMNVPGIVFADDRLMEGIREDQALVQVMNVACLPGIVRASLAMPDIHWGYGFPIGGVAAFDLEEGVISPGGVGYDINCGVRLLRSGLSAGEAGGRIRELVEALFRNIPTGVGSHRKDFRLDQKSEVRLLREGAAWAVKNGLGEERDLLHIEEGGGLEGADPACVSDRAKERGRAQLGTLGSGNHFVEVQRVAEVYDEEAARALGLERDAITISIHTGSRGLGYQVCDDFLQVMLRASRDHGIHLPDPQLCCAPVNSEEGRRYIGAMYAAANFAFGNRQLITHWVRQSFQEVFQKGPRDLGIEVVYDVCHNIAKIETHLVDGKERRLCVHRKGATRAFPAGHPQTPHAYRDVGQPVLIPGDMGRYSFVLVGTQRAFEETFGSTCHGAGRRLSRKAAKKSARGRSIVRDMEDRGIVVRADGYATLAEEIPEAYKDVAEVVDVVHRAGISRRVAKLVPIGVIKG